MTTVEDVLDRLFAESDSTTERGRKFERLTKAFLRIDAQWSALFDEVWEWEEWPGRQGRDTGIDLIARERDTGSLVAVQCKFYAPEHTVSKPDIDTFLATSGKHPFTGRLVVATTDRWNQNAEAAIRDQQIPVQRIGLTDLMDSSIDWTQFDPHEPEALQVKPRHELRGYQKQALGAVHEGLQKGDRGKLIMACGTGKTFTSLKIAQNEVAPGGSILFLVPSIALLSQTLKEWSIAAGDELRTFAVCSDAKIGRSAEDISTVDLPIPATTEPVRLAAAVGQDTMHRDAAKRRTVVFATYQSIDVVARAQAKGLGAFDLVICDEAHRTTGATIAGQDESAFVRVHDADYLKAAKRLYMTATPRIYDDASKTKAGQSQAVLASMDDEAVYGPELFRLGFGQAVSEGYLTDYKVLVLAVDEGTINHTMQGALTDPANSELQVDDVAKIIGCWNGLAKRGNSDHDFAADPNPMRRAVAFSRSIKDSKKFTDRFQSIADEYAASLDASDDDVAAPGRVNTILPVSVDHVDGSFNMVARNNLLAWLKEDTGELADGGEARVLSNAKCLAEGVDVPALDAVLFLNPRKSVVDVVQSVGRVMRRAPGKKYGYIILPIVIPAGTTPEAALRDNERYRVVWEVLQALRAHDERFDAMVNKIDLNKGRDDRISIIGVGGDEGDDYGDGSNGDDTGQQGVLDLSRLDDFRDAMYAKIVTKVGTRRYWEDWAKDVAQIAERHRNRLAGLLDDGQAAEEFGTFLTALRANLNESITRDDAIDMLSQHMVTAPVFSALFADYDFATHNPVSRVMDATLTALEGKGLAAETEQLESFYESVRTRVAGIDNAEGRQTVIKDLYEKFFKHAFPRVADQLGIVYTPIEIVDFIIRSVDHLLHEEFGVGIGDDGVHVLDPFTGTGTFIVRLLQSGLISPHDLARKYAEELHANEIMLLAYYIAAINIESTFHDLIREQDPEADYEPFEGIVLTDTFQMHEDDDTLDLARVFARNSDRAAAQMDLDIRVILGNPPYSVGQDSANADNANVAYPTLDKSIELTYAARSTASSKRTLYDSYIRAIRWASDRIGDSGIVGFVTNGGFLDSNATDGLRKTLTDEFATIYIYNLRGNQRTAGELSRKEGGKIFDAGSRATVAVTFLVKKPGHAGRAVLRYCDIGDYLSREDKLSIVRGSSVGSIEWTNITPNDAGDWINQRSGDFGVYQVIGDKGSGNGVFESHSLGVATGRDAFVTGFSNAEVANRASAMISHFNETLDRANAIAAREQRSLREVATSAIEVDGSAYVWTENDRANLARGRKAHFNDQAITRTAYRPFQNQALYFGRELNARVYQLPSMFPTPNHPNYGIYQVGAGSAVPFSVLALNALPNLHVTGAGSGGQFFSRWTYSAIADDGGADETAGTVGLFAELSAAAGSSSDSNDVVVDGYHRIDNITDATLKQYREWYGDALPDDVTEAKNRIFVFVYGLLHSSDYRERFAADLKRTLPRIPRVEAGDFTAFADAGQRLLDLHIDYENAAIYPLDISGEGARSSSDTDLYELYRVTKMRPVGKGRDKDRSAIVYNNQITVRGIPEQAHEYMLGSRSAIEWILDRYQVRTDKKSGITNDPNDWTREVGNPRYILDLIGKVVTVSVETVKIVENLPPLRIVTNA